MSFIESIAGEAISGAELEREADVEDAKAAAVVSGLYVPRLLEAACHTHAVLEQERNARESRRARLEAALPGMVERLKTLGAKQVVLFGSLARGEVGKRSDVDLIVVLDAPGRFLDRLALVDEALRDRDVPLDALVYTSEEFAELSRSRPFVRRALREGRVLYQA